MEKIEGRVSKVVYQSQKNYYTIMIFREAKSGTSFSVVGHFPIIHPFLKLTLFGKWIHNKKYGKQFETSSYQIMEPKDATELVDFLISRIVDCPYPIAFDIARYIGLDYLNHYADIKYCLNLLPNRAETESILTMNALYLKSFIERKSLLEELMKMGFEQSLACKMVFSEYSPSIESIRENPYSLIRKYDVKWKDMDDIALKNGFTKQSQIRIEQGILYLLEEASSSHAHMYLPQDILGKKAKKFLEVEFNIESVLTQMKKDNKIVRDTKDRIYSEENYRSERSLAENLFRLAKSEPLIPSKEIKIDTRDFSYSTDQVEAIEMVLKNQVSVIIGPAGTGKTTIILKMIQELKKMGHKIQLCAPTGRAAKRMSEVTKMKAKTNHHLLAFNPETKRPTFDRDNPLDGTCFIMDEGSMADIIVTSYLANAIPDGAKFIIIGDENQLPSIGPGTVLKDLVEGNFFPTKKLNQVFRQKEGSYLLEYATRIRNGEPLDVSSLPEKCDFKFFNLKKASSIQEGIKRLVKSFVKSGKFDIFNDLQIISPIHASEIGVKELNSIVQDIFNPNAKQEIEYGNKVFRTGDKIIQLRNNYDKNVYNGDIGRIESIDKRNKSIIVDIYGEKIEYIGEEIFELDLAYVLTVHKVQGGEYPFVIMVLHPIFGKKMINRKLFYTAETRAKKQFCLLSTEETIQFAIDNNEDELRYCNLVSRLKAARLKKIFS